jgi:hypothetical protein
VLLGVHSLCDELAQGCPAQVWQMWCFACDMASQRHYGGAHPLLGQRDDTEEEGVVGVSCGTEEGVVEGVGCGY